MTVGSRRDFSELGVILSYKPRANNQEMFKLANVLTIESIQWEIYVHGNLGGPCLLVFGIREMVGFHG